MNEWIRWIHLKNISSVFVSCTATGTYDFILKLKVMYTHFLRFNYCRRWRWGWSHATTHGRSVSQYVLASSPLWNLRPDINSVRILLFCLCWAPSQTRGRVCFLSVTVSNNCPTVKFFFFSSFHFTLHTFCVYTIYARPSQHRLSTDHAPLFVACTTTTVKIWTDVRLTATKFKPFNVNYIIAEKMPVYLYNQGYPIISKYKEQYRQLRC
jgi:hypothetical protein